jgi:hypothetical protein
MGTFIDTPDQRPQIGSRFAEFVEGIIKFLDFIADPVRVIARHFADLLFDLLQNFHVDLRHFGTLRQSANLGGKPVGEFKDQNIAAIKFDLLGGRADNLDVFGFGLAAFFRYLALKAAAVRSE